MSKTAQQARLPPQIFLVSMEVGGNTSHSDVSRNPRNHSSRRGWPRWFAALILIGMLAGPDRVSGESTPRPTMTPPSSRVIVVRDPEATEAFQAQPEKVRELVRLGILKLTGETNTARAWASLVKPRDVVGIKVYCSPGPASGTRPSVVAAVIEGLLEAGLPATNIVIWDRQKGDLRLSGFVDLADRYGTRAEGSVNAGFDEDTFYSPDTPLLGQLVWGDLEFGRKGDGIGRKSYVSKLVTKGMTRIINVTPLLNHNTAGVCGNLFSLALGSVDNVMRFEPDTRRLATAVPEIYALPSLGDRVVLNITDALICQYHGEQRSLLHYSTVLNEIRLSKDAVALDFLSLRELDRERAGSSTVSSRYLSLTNYMELIENAALLELGRGDADHIKIERIP